MKILITGGNGQLGSTLLGLLNKKECILGKVDKTYNQIEVFNSNKDMLDITNLRDVRNQLLKLQPQVVINAAAYTHVDLCESNIDLCYSVNALGPRNLAMACEDIQAKLIHISTDYVFDGKSPMPYREFDLPNPLNMYGRSKLLGEEYVKQFCSSYFIIRTSWLYGSHGKNFVKTILNTVREKQKLDVVADQIGTPTNTLDLSYHLLKLALTDEYGIYHCSGNGQCSWYEFAKAITAYADIDCSIRPIASQDYPSAAPRPAYSTLDHGMLRCTIGDQMRNWEEALKDFIANLS